MHNYLRQKRGVQDIEVEIQDIDAETVAETERPPVLSHERWNRDPFNSFPIKMQPYMHGLLYSCKSTTPYVKDH